MATQRIETPRGVISAGRNGTVQLAWNPAFRSNWQGGFNRSQKIVDSEVLRLSEPYTPLRTSMLVKSGTLGTVIGSGEVAWIAPYAKRQYYSSRAPGSTTGPLRGPRWFDRMKVAHMNNILRIARSEMGAR